MVKARELSVLLDFYLARADRYGLVAPDAAEEARFFLRTIDEGYRLRFTRTGLVFDFAKEGLDQADEELGVEFHRIGVDRIRALVDAACAAEAEPAMAEASAESFALRPRTIEAGRTAAFLSPARDWTVDWESVTTSEEDLKAEKIGASSEGEPSRAAEGFVAARPAGYDVLLGTRGNSPQFGILGEAQGRKIALDLNETQTISLFGVQGGGKSYTLGSIVEMALRPIPGINRLPQPLGGVIFHYSPTMDYAVDGLIEVIREMRHKGTSILIASQDPQSVQVKVIELSTQVVLHKFNSPAWLKHIQKANAALSELTPGRMAQLHPGEAFLWSSKATDDAFTRGAVKILCRPRATAHGGGTRTAV